MNITRLKNRADFIQARKGARSHERAFVLQLFERSPLHHPNAYQLKDLRVGFTVTKKIGNAVLRNRIKRRLREALKQSEIPPRLAGCDAVFIARNEAAKLPFQDLVTQMSHAFVCIKQHGGKSGGKQEKNKNQRDVAKTSPAGQKRRKKH